MCSANRRSSSAVFRFSRRPILSLTSCSVNAAGTLPTSAVARKSPTATFALPRPGKTRPTFASINSHRVTVLPASTFVKSCSRRTLLLRS